MKNVLLIGVATLFGFSLQAQNILSDLSKITGSTNSIPSGSTNSSQASYLLPVITDAAFTSILTAGDVAGGYKMCGTPDGIGAFDNGNGTFTILMNHEFGNTAGVARAHGSKGSFVSKWIVNKSDLSVVSGSDLIQTVKLWNGSGYTSYNASNPSSLTALNRFCSADLPAVSAFYNSSTGLGTQARIFMNGEESGNEGRAFAHIATGPEAGTSYELPYLGKFSWENSVACPFSGNKTIVAGMDDSTPGQVYFYIGTKTNSGTDIDKAGLSNGKLFGIAVTGLTTETNASVPAPNSPFTLADLGQVQNKTGAAINSSSNNLGVTTFLRPEDGAWDPAHPGDFYFATTNAFNSPSRLWKVQFTDINNPELGGTITAVLNGTEGQQMLDNLTIDNSGHILLVEDVGGNAHIGKVWQYTIATDELKQVGAHDPTRFLNGAPNFLTQDEEASGVLDVQSILGPGMFLIDVQAHYGISGEVVEGGQLLAYYNPDSYASNPEIAVKGNNVNITDGDMTPSVVDSTHFGIVTIGQPRTRSFIIQNTGTGDLLISGINFSGTNADEFSLVGTVPATIAAGGTATIFVRFNPTSIANRTAIIRINNNDLDESIFDFMISGTATDQITANSSSQPPYLLPTIPGATFTSMLTAGDVAGGYKMCGTPDGIGAFDNGNGTFTILMNHEFGNTAGVARAHGSKGSFVSKWIVNKSDLSVVSGSDLIQTVKLWNGSGYTSYNASNPSSLTALNRFCSADLPAVSAFYNSSTGLGTQARIFMNGEESGNEGRAFAHIATGPEAGTSYELPYLGKFSWENSVACPFSGNKTIVAGMDDSTPGQVYFYIGTKTNSGTDIDKAGLSNGKLFGIAVTGLTTETNASVPAPNSPFTLADLGQVQNKTGAAINSSSNNLGVTTFLRPEDGAWDPAHPGDFYFATTNAFNSPSRLWKVQFTDINNPELGGTITAVLNGTEGQQMLDNLTIDNSGHILLVEDVGGNAHIGKVWQYTIATDELKQVGAHDPTRFLNGAPNFLTQDEEASGVLDVQSILGPGMFLIDVQAHYGISGEVVEGGQLLAYYNPDSYNATPLVYDVTGGGSFCAGDTAGLAIGLSHSQINVNYQLIKDGNVPIGSPVAGTGTSILFENQTGAGTYTVIAIGTVSNDTINMNDSATIFINPLPAVNVTVAGDTNICAADSVMLTATGSVGSTYAWSNGETTQTIVVDTAGTYSVILTDVNGCSSIASTPVTITTFTVPEDFNNDGVVSSSDLSILLASFGMTCTCPSDLNQDGKVTTIDLNKFISVFGSTCSGLVTPLLPPFQQD